MTVESPSRTCPRCEASVAPDAKFCPNCGQPLTGASTDDVAIHARLTAAAPTPLITKMRATRLTGERKPVSALFVDDASSNPKRLAPPRA
jgi:predicted amidophosphoribosyltransferase